MENTGQPKQGTGNANEQLQQQNPGNTPDNTPTPNKEGGHGGYSQDEEQQQVNRENDDMHKERDQGDLDTSREQKIKTDDNGGTPGKEGGNDDYKRNA